MRATFVEVLLMVIGLSGCSFLGVSPQERWYRRYVGLGDSISIDEYAGGPGWGAISLFYCNKMKSTPNLEGRTSDQFIRK